MQNLYGMPKCYSVGAGKTMVKIVSGYIRGEIAIIKINRETSHKAK